MFSFNGKGGGVFGGYTPTMQPTRPIQPPTPGFPQPPIPTVLAGHSIGGGVSMQVGNATVTGTVTRDYDRNFHNPSTNVGVTVTIPLK
jgi:hypothetical protein